MKSQEEHGTLTLIQSILESIENIIDTYRESAVIWKYKEIRR